MKNKKQNLNFIDTTHINENENKNDNYESIQNQVIIKKRYEKLKKIQQK